MSLADAVARARAYVREAIATAPGFGRGHGPLNHAVTVNDESSGPRLLPLMIERRTAAVRTDQISGAFLSTGSAGVHLPASASIRKFQSSRLKASGSSMFTVWPVLANMARPALGSTRLR